jgi:hypothetical protein
MNTIPKKDLKRLKPIALKPANTWHSNGIMICAHVSISRCILNNLAPATSGESDEHQQSLPEG